MAVSQPGLFLNGGLKKDLYNHSRQPLDGY